MRNKARRSERRRRGTRRRGRSPAGSAGRRGVRAPWGRARTWTSKGQRAAYGTATENVSLAAITVDVVGDEGAAEAALLVAAVRDVSGELGVDGRRKVIERVQLAVEVVERRPDRGAAVLERHHVSWPSAHNALCGHGGSRRGRSVAGRTARPSSARVVGRVNDDLASSRGAGHEPIVGDRRRRCERWKSVVEHRDVERPRQLRAAGAQRARIGDHGDGATRPRVACRRHDDPATSESIEASLQGRPFIASGDGLAVERPVKVPVHVELPAVGVDEPVVLERDNGASVTIVRCRVRGMARRVP